MAVALILAGGRSSRMGRDKALVPWEGIPMLQRVVQVAEGCCHPVFIQTPWPQRYETVVSPPCQWLEETQPDQGSLAAFAEGLAQITSQSLPIPDWVLLLACDLPRLESAVLSGWRDQAAQLSPDCLALVPRKSTFWDPLCAFYRPTVLPFLEHSLAHEERSWQRWLETIPVQPLVLTTTEERLLWNCNSPADLDLAD